jgi:hypothetical protein
MVFGQSVCQCSVTGCSVYGFWQEDFHMAKSSHNSSQNNDGDRHFNGKRRKIELTRSAPNSERGLTHTPYFNGPLYERMSQDLHLGGKSKRTHEGYLRAVRHLADFCKLSPHLISEDQLRKFFSASEE